jgi:hypothetical protein
MKIDTYLALDEHGNPVLLGKPVAITNDESKLTKVDDLEWVRRSDIIRDTAREFEEFSDQDIRERLRGITSRQLDATEISQFREDVRAQVLDDLVDILNWSHFGRLRTRRTVRLTAPKGYIRKTLNSLSKEELEEIEARLQAHGWGDLEIEALRARRSQKAS